MVGNPAISVRALVYTPRHTAKPHNGWPLVLFLHGAGKAPDGSDDSDEVIAGALPELVQQGADFPFVLVSPRSPQPNWDPEVVIQILNQALASLEVDPNRVYLTGVSMGGNGTWATVARYPDRFAAAIPICGWGEPSWAGHLTSVPIWAFHGEKDDVIPVARSEEMAEAIRMEGGKAKLTVLPDQGHHCAQVVYQMCEVFDWLLQQRRGSRTSVGDQHAEREQKRLDTP